MKLLIIDDHQPTGIAPPFGDPKYQVEVLLAKDIAEGIAFIHSYTDIDAVLLDIALPGPDGITALEMIADARSALPVIIVTASEDPNDVRHALRSGAVGYVPKSAATDTLMSALTLVLAGDVYVPPIILRESPERSTEDKRTASSNLTHRQAEILKLLARGLSNKDIGRQLGLSERTVKAHVTGIFKSLRVSNRVEASKYAPPDHPERKF